MASRVMHEYQLVELKGPSKKLRNIGIWDAAYKPRVLAIGETLNLGVTAATYIRFWNRPQQTTIPFLINSASRKF